MRSRLLLPRKNQIDRRLIFLTMSVQKNVSITHQNILHLRVGLKNAERFKLKNV